MQAKTCKFLSSSIYRRSVVQNGTKWKRAELATKAGVPAHQRTSAERRGAGALSPAFGDFGPPDGSDAARPDHILSLRIGRRLEFCLEMNRPASGSEAVNVSNRRRAPRRRSICYDGAGSIPGCPSRGDRGRQPSTTGLWKRSNPCRCGGAHRVRAHSSIAGPQRASIASVQHGLIADVQHASIADMQRL